MIDPPAPSPHSYHVPERFSIAAVLAFMTGFALLFGLLRLMQAPMFLYLFFGCEALVVSAAQMVFRARARRVSVIAGAILMPAWLLAMPFFRGRATRTFVYLIGGWSWGDAAMGLFCAVVAGGLLGYCTGAFAAGIFLVLDRLDRRFRPREEFGRSGHSV